MSDGENRALQWVRAAAIPLAVAIGTIGLGWWTQVQQRGSDERRLEALYVELAIEILSQPPIEDPDPNDDVDPNDERKPLKDWAFQLLAQSSPTEIPGALREQYESDQPPVLLPSIDPDVLRRLLDNAPTTSLPANCRMVRVGDLTVPICS